ncbi:MAG: tRNA (guanosine(37)-N1)-methyltransferase TrmD [Patescibacteria group bacterium]|jgi:tRNA (guanine37-N1)-methyltransferase|nr:tRNA (guanosine(37)-N1)-methyltransferase TrmD [Patescibacteria group bacterium]
MQFDILTIFPQAFESYFNSSILKKAQANKKIKINLHDIRQFTTDKHHTVDDKPYGGGVGMVLKFEPVYRTLSRIKRKSKSKVILFEAGGKEFTQRQAQGLSKLDQLIMICGHYEGLDARINKLVDLKISVGNYVLTGGEIPAMIVVDTISRLIPGVLGKAESFKRDTFYRPGYKKYPQYTRPGKIIFKNKKGFKKELKVPQVLLSGNHQAIQLWQEKHSQNT